MNCHRVRRTIEMKIELADHWIRVWTDTTEMVESRVRRIWIHPLLKEENCGNHSTKDVVRMDSASMTYLQLTDVVDMNAIVLIAMVHCCLLDLRLLHSPIGVCPVSTHFARHVEGNERMRLRQWEWS